MQRILIALRSGLVATSSTLLMVALSLQVAYAGNPPGKAMDKVPPINTFVPVLSPRQPAPIPHSMVLDSSATNAFIQGDGLRPQSTAAAAHATQQGTKGKPGVLQTTTSIASGLTLFDPEDVCNDFDARGQWEGEVWTEYFAGWGPFAADDGYFQAKNVTFSREAVVGPGSNFERAEASLKIASNQPYDAGVMSPPIEVDPGDRVRVRVFYLIFNHDTEGRNWDYASMGIIPKLGERASYVLGYQRGEWAVLEQEIVAQGEEVVVMLQGHSPAALNSNIYFDNVSIWINDRAERNCRR